MILAFGLIVMGYLAFFAFTLSITPTILLSYLIAPLLGRGLTRIGSQLGLLAILWPVMLVVTAAVVWGGTSSTGGGSVELWGRTYHEMTEPAVRTTYLAPVVIVLGEALLYWWQRRKPGMGFLAAKEAEDVAAVFGDDEGS